MRLTKNTYIQVRMRVCGYIKGACPVAWSFALYTLLHSEQFEMVLTA